MVTAWDSDIMGLLEGKFIHSLFIDLSEHHFFMYKSRVVEYGCVIAILFIFWKLQYCNYTFWLILRYKSFHIILFLGRQQNVLSIF